MRLEFHLSHDVSIKKNWNQYLKPILSRWYRYCEQFWQMSQYLVEWEKNSKCKNQFSLPDLRRILVLAVNFGFIRIYSRATIIKWEKVDARYSYLIFWDHPRICGARGRKMQISIVIISTCNLELKYAPDLNCRHHLINNWIRCV